MIKEGVDKDLIETIEFFDPKHGLGIEEYIRRNQKQGIHHLGRYHWAKDVLKLYGSKNILDIACGSGYGSFILSKEMSSAQIVGADYDQRGVDLAKSKYTNPNLVYKRGNIVTWKSGLLEQQDLGLYDAIVSFDTIEHLLHREISLIRMTQNLTEGGILLLSTPCGHHVTRLKPGWEHHKIEYSHYDLVNLLKRFFKTVLLPVDSDFPNISYWNEVINKGELRYLNRANPLVCIDPIKY